MSFLEVLAADLGAQIDSRHYSGVRFWSKAIAKLLITPAVQVVVLFRISSAFYRWPVTRPFAFILRSVSVVWGGTEIHPSVEIGPGFCLMHSQKVVIASGVRIGAGVRVAHGVTIGGDTGRTFGAAPRIGDNAMIGADAYILGDVTVGRWAMIGAKSLVLKDVPDFGVVVGNPARLLRIAEPSEYGLESL